MPSVHKQPGRPHYFAAFYDADGRRKFVSTKTSDRRKAQAICDIWAKTARVARSGVLTPDRAREIIAEGVSNVMLASSAGEGLPSVTMGVWIDRWLDSKAQVVEENSQNRYRVVLKRFEGHLGAKAKKDINHVTASDVSSFRDVEAKRLSNASANFALKLLRAVFSDAVKLKFITSSPTATVAILKKGLKKGSRRAFTVSEIRRILEAAKDTEWHAVVLFGLYTGQRLGDLCRLTWKQVDLDKNEMDIVTQKTNRHINLPLAAPLRDALVKLPSSDNPGTYLFPKLAEASLKNGSTVSNQFYEILVTAGLREAKTHQKKKNGKGRSAKRETSEVSFHSLRHSAVSFLKSHGVNDAMAREIVGHESDAVSRVYTHFTSEDMRRALEKLPDVTSRNSK